MSDADWFAVFFFPGIFLIPLAIAAVDTLAPRMLARRREQRLATASKDLLAMHIANTTRSTGRR